MFHRLCVYMCVQMVCGVHLHHAGPSPLSYVGVHYIPRRLDIVALVKFDDGKFASFI